MLDTLPIAVAVKLPKRWRWRIRLDASTGCWLWRGYVDGDGYGQARGPDGRTWQAHRLVYTTLVGPIGEGLDLDHECRVRACVRPGLGHLVPREPTVNRSRRPPEPLPPPPRGQIPLFDPGPVAQREPGWRRERKPPTTGREEHADLR